MRVPQVTPPWSTGIYIGNGVVATRPKAQDTECPDCLGDGVVERIGRNGPYETECTNCYGSLGRVNLSDMEMI